MAQARQGWKIGGVSTENELLDLGFEGGEETPVVEVPEDIQLPGEADPVEEAPKSGIDGSVDSIDQFEEEFGAATTEEESGETPPVAPTTIDAVYLKAKAVAKAEIYGIEIPEDVEWDDETYMEFETQLDDFRLEQKYGSYKSSTPEMEALLEIAENGGDIGTLIEIFGARKELKAIDTSTPEGKIQKIRKYYTDIENKTPAWTDKHIRRLQVSDDESDLEEEFAEVNTAYDEHFASETQRRVQEAESARIAQEAREKAQRESFAATLKEASYKDADANKLINFVYNNKAFKHPKTGETYSEFDVAILKAKNDPKKLADVVLFLSDQAAYDKRVAVAASSSTVEKTFKKIKDTANGITPPAASTSPGKTTGFIFKLKDKQ